MHAEMNASAGAEPQSAFQWNAWGWWGSVVGAIAWMLVIAAFMIVNGERMVAAIPLTSAVMLVALAALLWSRRGSMSAFNGLMFFCFAAAFAVPITYYATGYFASPATLAQMRWSNSPAVHCMVFGLVPYTMVQFWLRERSERGALPTRLNDTERSATNRRV